MSHKQLNIAERLLYSAPGTFDELSTLVEQVLKDTVVRRVHAHVLLSESDLTRSLVTDRATHLVTRECLAREENSISLRISSRLGRKRRRVVAGCVTVVRLPESGRSWVAVFHEGGEFAAGPLHRLLRAARPRIARPLLNTAQIRDTLNRLQLGIRFNDLRIRQIGSRSRIFSEGAARAVEADRRWTDLTVDEAFKEMRASGEWITDVTASYRAGLNSGTVKMTRRGRLAFAGSAVYAFDFLVKRVAGLGEERYGFLHGRARTEATNYESRPFEIRFDAPVLRDGEQIGALSRVLHDIPHVSCTVVHGNPYFHAVLVDYTDGSVYEALVMQDHAVTVIPQGRATVRALQRLSSAVFASFREGTLQEPGSHA